ncbi:aldo/keto reductase [Clostridium felsineum]|uniref:aldo/keto reductase n=1 Tax=Clostridium felsineum TaxID=36839 RepID=UPI00098CC5DE|nr:aldo/keto reductase [Clostridium felsineum]URZ16654.1 Aldo-keto reductase IolS [Clostridium felsineum DSM 794]
MKKQILGKNLKVSAVSLGCMGMTHAYGVPADVNEMTKLIEEAVNMGYTMFDTAECYAGTNSDGSMAYNEELVGKALRAYRDKVVIASKFGVQITPTGLHTDSRPDTIRKSIEGSLKRLGTDYIDLYYQHRVDANVPVEEVAGVMKELIKEGKILHWGISEVDEETIQRAHAVCPITAIQNRYSMMYRDTEDLFPVLEELNIGLVAFSPLANGALTDAYKKSTTFNEKGDYRSFMPQFKPEAYDANKELLDMLHHIAEEKNSTPAAISLAWMICKRPWIVPIAGTRKLTRLKENASAADIELTTQEVNKIDKLLDNMKMSEIFGGSRVNR